MNLHPAVERVFFELILKHLEKIIAAEGPAMRVHPRARAKAMFDRAVVLIRDLSLIKPPRRMPPVEPVLQDNLSASHARVIEDLDAIVNRRWLRLRAVEISPAVDATLDQILPPRILIAFVEIVLAKQIPA